MSQPYDPEYFRWRRGKALDRCLRLRALIKKGDVHADDGHIYTVGTMKFFLRKDQMNLLKMRIWRATGTYPRDDN